jgi:hypothetical protein
MPRVVGDSRQGRVVVVAGAACCTACAVRQRQEGLPLGRGGSAGMAQGPGGGVKMAWVPMRRQMTCAWPGTRSAP